MIPAPQLDGMVIPLAREVLDAFESELAELESPPSNISLRSGTEVAVLLSTTRNESCEGIAWVRVVTFYPSTTNFPEPEAAAAKCAPARWAVVLELGVGRCAPVGTAEVLPTLDQQNALAVAIQDDAAAMLRAVCRWAQANPRRLHLVGPWDPMPTEGALAGGHLVVTFQTDFACPPPQGS